MSIAKGFVILSAGWATFWWTGAAGCWILSSLGVLNFRKEGIASMQFCFALAMMGFIGLALSLFVTFARAFLGEDSGTK